MMLLSTAHAFLSRHDSFFLDSKTRGRSCVSVKHSQIHVACVPCAATGQRDVSYLLYPSKLSVSLIGLYEPS
jgi:hypothetical protein